MPYVKGPRHPLFFLDATGGKAYCGRIIDEQLRRIVHCASLPDESLALARTYSPQDDFALIWFFDAAGKLARLVCEESYSLEQLTHSGTTPPKPRVTTILSVIAGSVESKRLTMRCERLPAIINLVDNRLQQAAYSKKYFHLVFYGHLLARKLKTHIHNKTVLEPFEYIQGQRPMYEFKTNQYAVQTLNSIAALHVNRMSMQGSPEVQMLEYVPYQEPHMRARALREQLGVE